MTEPATTPESATTPEPTSPAASKDATGPEPDTTPTEPVSHTTDIMAGPGGVMTNEVGVITGELTVRTELSGERVTVRVQYKEAEEWYVVTGGKATIKDPADVEAVHKIVVGILNRPEG